MSALFNKQNFERNFNDALNRITASEAISKKELMIVSRTILEAWHITGNKIYINRLLKAVTPVNKKVLIEFGTHFGGFSYDKVLGEFTHKSKKRYEKAHALALEFLADPHNNLWTWAERHITVIQKPFAIENVEKFIKSALDKGAGVGLSQVDILKAVFKAGVSPECVIQVMDELGFEFGEAETTQNFSIEPAPM